MFNPRLTESLTDFPFARLNALLAPIAPPAHLSPINMSVGEPQGAMPAFARQIVNDEIDGWNRYPPNQGLPDLTSLHCAVSPGGCNIHIDETGFVITDDQGKPVLDADFLQHLVNELLFKTYAKKILPDIIVNRVNLILPSSFVDFDRIGASVDLYRTKNFRVALSGTCSISGDHECVGTVTVSGRF